MRVSKAAKHSTTVTEEPLYLRLGLVNRYIITSSLLRTQIAICKALLSRRRHQRYARAQGTANLVQLLCNCPPLHPLLKQLAVVIDTGDMQSTNYAKERDASNWGQQLHRHLTAGPTTVPGRAPGEGAGCMSRYSIATSTRLLSVARSAVSTCSRVKPISISCVTDCSLGTNGA